MDDLAADDFWNHCVYKIQDRFSEKSLDMIQQMYFSREEILVANKIEKGI